MSEKSNQYAKTNTAGHLIHIVFTAPSMAVNIDVDWEKIGVQSEDLPKVSTKFTPPKVHEEIIKPFHRIRSRVDSVLERNTVRSLNLKLLAPWNKTMVNQEIFELEAEWLRHLEQVEQNFIRLQGDVLHEIVNDPNIQGWEHRDNYVEFVLSKMPDKDGFIQRHRKFSFELVDLMSGSHNDDEFEAMNSGLERIREGAAGNLIQEIAVAANDFMGKLDKGRVQSKSQEVMMAKVAKCDDFQFLAPRFAYLASVLNDVVKTFPKAQSITDPNLIATLHRKIRPFCDQFLLEEVIFEDRDLYVTETPTAKAKPSQTSEAIIRAEQARLQRKEALFKQNGHDVLANLRKEVSGDKSQETDDGQQKFELNVVDFDEVERRKTV